MAELQSFELWDSLKKKRSEISNSGSGEVKASAKFFLPDF